MTASGLPKVSVIMPTYNRAGFILESIESVRKQTYVNWELLIIDDGSTDTTKELVEGLQDDRIILFKAGRIGIGGKIKNIGLQLSNESLVAFIDSDDLWAPSKLEKQVAALHQFPEAGFCLTGGYNFRVKHQPVDFFYKQKEGMKYDSFFLSFFKSELPGFTQALLFRRKCLDKTGLFREAKAFSDVDFIISLAYHFKGVILYEPLVFRRLHLSSYSDPNWIKSYYEGIEVIRIWKDKIPFQLYREALSRLHINFGESYLSRGQQGKAMLQFLQAWKYKPFSIVPFKKTGKAILFSFGRK